MGERKEGNERAKNHNHPISIYIEPDYTMICSRESQIKRSTHTECICWHSLAPLRRMRYHSAHLIKRMKRNGSFSWGGGTGREGEGEGGVGRD